MLEVAEILGISRSSVARFDRELLPELVKYGAKSFRIYERASVLALRDRRAAKAGSK